MEDVAGREVLVLDDIMTTGATARECARVLKAAGAAKVWVATLARAQKTEHVRYDEAQGSASWNSHEASNITGERRTGANADA